MMRTTIAAAKGLSRLNTGSVTAKRCYSDWPYLRDEHRMVYQMCKDFADTELIPIAGKLDKEHKYPKEQVARLGELGMFEDPSFVSGLVLIYTLNSSYNIRNDGRCL
jgi:alkylation response protein AidB-like acyl-CoA dehydrogenase